MSDKRKGNKELMVKLYKKNGLIAASVIFDETKEIKEKDLIKMVEKQDIATIDKNISVDCVITGMNTVGLCVCCLLSYYQFRQIDKNDRHLSKNENGQMACHEALLLKMGKWSKNEDYSKCTKLQLLADVALKQMKRFENENENDRLAEPAKKKRKIMISSKNGKNKQVNKWKSILKNGKGRQSDSEWKSNIMSNEMKNKMTNEKKERKHFGKQSAMCLPMHMYSPMYSPIYAPMYAPMYGLMYHAMLPMQPNVQWYDDKWPAMMPQFNNCFVEINNQIDNRRSDNHKMNSDNRTDNHKMNSDNRTDNHRATTMTNSNNRIDSNHDNFRNNNNNNNQNNNHDNNRDSKFVKMAPIEIGNHSNSARVEVPHIY